MCLGGDIIFGMWHAKQVRCVVTGRDGLHAPLQSNPILRERHEGGFNEGDVLSLQLPRQAVVEGVEAGQGLRLVPAGTRRPVAPDRRPGAQSPVDVGGEDAIVQRKVVPPTPFLGDCRGNVFLPRRRRRPGGLWIHRFVHRSRIIRPTVGCTGSR